MNTITIIIIAIVGITLGYWLARQRRASGSLVSEQSRKKQENINKVLEFVQQNGKVKNAEVEKLLGVSDATAERYLNELEKDGKIKQHGVIGQNVFYTLK